MKSSEKAAETKTPNELVELCQGGSDPILLDVRTPAEFGEVHIKGARLEPLEGLDAERLATEFGDRTVHVICRSGNRAKQAMHKLEAAGFGGSVLLEGGMNAWVAADLPVERGRKVMSLERQVRIAAGALVVLGAVLGWVLEIPALHAISAFVGAGLMFAGLTDSCAMGMLIAKMPWNQRVRSAA
ncbi:MAG: rhodanese-like domain-containing protein [Verrucomicrobiales bacterium]